MSFATGRVDYAPGFGPYSHPEEGDWVALAPLRAADIGGGRQDDLDEIEPAGGTLTLDDAAGAVFAAAFDGTAAANTPVRVIVTYDGVDHVAFSGYMLDAPEPAGGRDRLATVKVIDWMGWAAKIELPESKWGMWTAARNPLLWWKDTATGAIFMNHEYNERVVNLGTLGPPGDLYAVLDPSGNYLNGLSREPLYELGPEGESGKPWINGYSSTREIIDFGGTYTLAFWLLSRGSIPSATTTLFKLSSEPFGGVNALDVRVTSTGRIQVAGGGITVTTTIDQNHFDEKPHLIVINVSPSTITVTTDIASGSGSPSVAPTTSGYLWFNARPRVLFLFAEFVVWPGTITTLPSDWVTYGELWNTGPIWYEDTAGERIENLCAAARVPTPPILDTSDPGHMSGRLITTGGNLAAAIKQVAASRFGVVFVAADGTLRVRSYSTLVDYQWDHLYNDRLAALTDVDFPSTVPIWNDGSVWGDDATDWWPDLPTVRVRPNQTKPGRVDQIINAVTVEWDWFGIATEFGARDGDSVAIYGERAITRFSDLADASMIRDAPDDLLRRRATPKVEVGKVKVDVWGNENAAALALAADLESPLHYHETGPAGAAVAEGLYRIQHKHWSWQDGTHWTVIYTIAAAV